MREIVQWAGFVLGIAIVFLVWGSLVRTAVLPRGHLSRLSVIVGRVLVRRTFLFVAGRFDDYERKDRILAVSAPISLLVLLVVWLLGFCLGFALMIWPLANETFAAALREAGSSMLTIGFVSTESPAATAVDFVAGMTGLVVIAVQIAYLPTLYGSFNRRETVVTMLQSRAGAPAWGPEILARAQQVGILGSLPQLYEEWERWAADVTESHTSYPVLIWFRSPHPLRSWIVGLVAVMDSAAMYSALSPTSAPIEGRLALRMGFTCLRNIADVMGISYDPDPFPDDPIELTYEEFLGGVHRLQKLGFPMERTPEEAWDHFRGWRVNYEAVAYAIADSVVAPPGPWSGPRARLPNISIIPQRPANRSPDDKREEEPKTKRFGWHA
jgi:hypothetical protein